VLNWFVLTILFEFVRLSTCIHCSISVSLTAISVFLELLTSWDRFDFPNGLPIIVRTLWCVLKYYKLSANRCGEKKWGDPYDVGYKFGGDKTFLRKQLSLIILRLSRAKLKDGVWVATTHIPKWATEKKRIDSCLVLFSRSAGLTPYAKRRSSNKKGY